MEDCLKRLCTQDYPCYELVFVTRDGDDPATPVIGRVMADAASAGRCPCRHVLAGPATRNGQKNHNLLRGLDHINSDREVLAFCDSSHVAQPDWLRRLVAPIARNRALVATSYHHVIPADTRLATVGRAITVLNLYLLQQVNWLRQPWGGNTAIKRSCFEELEVRTLWETTVVDDVSLAARLQTAGIPVATAAGAMLATPLGGETISGWSTWLIRQLLYLKFCFPGSWALIGVLLLVLATSLVFACTQAAGLVYGTAPGGASLPALVFALSLVLLGATLRSCHPCPGRPATWFAAALANIGMAAWCFLRGLTTTHIVWRGISYRVAWGGKVRRITMDREAAGPARG
jgi:cellulose synthase/poly-beta-1,6-N-acetylglucosamine synthase-like glycosyltransferase